MGFIKKFFTFIGLLVFVSALMFLAMFAFIIYLMIELVAQTS